MSDNKSDEEQQQQMEKIFICADVLLEVFNFLDPFELGLKMALISDQYDALVDVHFKSREWSLDWMKIRRATDGNGAQIVNARFREGLPIPQGPLPDKVIGFKYIEISYVDQTVIEFLQRIRRLFDFSGTNVFIGTDVDESRAWDLICQKIWPLVNDNICGFLHLDPSVLGRLREFSPTILRNCPRLRSIHSLGLFPNFPAADNTASSCRVLAKWLLTPRGDGLPTVLCCAFYGTTMDEFIESFVSASESANFIVKFLEDDDFKPFELKNNWTGERLTFRRIGEKKWLLVRCPLAREEDKWANWEKEAIQWESDSQWNFIAITFEDRDIGDGFGRARDGRKFIRFF
uniref:F-box domain-containing protein n=1 Tax=Globodera pallida TaxID=36090 RepID=A0A183BJU2_GLOPA